MGVHAITLRAVEILPPPSSRATSFHFTPAQARGRTWLLPTKMWTLNTDKLASSISLKPYGIYDGNLEIAGTSTVHEDSAQADLLKSGDRSNDTGDSTTEDAFRKDEFKRQRVEKLLSKLRGQSEGPMDADELTSIYDFQIDEFQRSAIEGFLKGFSVVVSAPTSSGKTLIAEAAALAAMAGGKRIFYTTPLKALSNQKFRDFKGTFGESNVGLLTGDSSVNHDAPILIMTTEILRNMLYESVGATSSSSSQSGLLCVETIVLDEVHYLSDFSRGTVWEEIVIYSPKEVQLICLSATVSNPEELAGWINKIHGETRLVTSSKRPVPLRWYISTRTSLLPLLDSMRRQAPQLRFSKPRPSQYPQMRDTLRQLMSGRMLPAVWFVFSRTGCDDAVDLCDVSLLDISEEREVRHALTAFRTRFPDAVRSSALRGLRRGIASHHAGCLPLWKLFVEELFQKGLLKIVFATETLAAGMNMPAKTAVVSSLNRRTANGWARLSTSELFQLAGRAGRRGSDERGNVVLVQAPDGDAEDCRRLISAGVQPVASRFSASYGMVLNLLSAGRPETARNLVERSFRNYVGNSVTSSSRLELEKIEEEIRCLSLEPGVGERCRESMPETAYDRIVTLEGELEAARLSREEALRTMETAKVVAYRRLLTGLEPGFHPYIVLEYKDAKGFDRSMPCMLLGCVDTFSHTSKAKAMIDTDGAFEVGEDASYYVALGSDNSWYLFTERWVRAVYKTGLLPNGLVEIFDRREMHWRKLARSPLGDLWVMEGSLDTWSWSRDVPVQSRLDDSDHPVFQLEALCGDSVEAYGRRRREVAVLEDRLRLTDGFAEYMKAKGNVRATGEKVALLSEKSDRLRQRLLLIEPYGWKEFRQLSDVANETGALDADHRLLPLGETAAAVRGDNELWLAMVLLDRSLLGLTPSQLAGVCAGLVSDGIRMRPDYRIRHGSIFQTSVDVRRSIDALAPLREALLRVQKKHGTFVPCPLDGYLSGVVEAWASGLNWVEIMPDCAVDDGDLARLLRRTIDLLNQMSKLPFVDPVLKETASSAAYVMDRPPITELVG